MRGRKLGSTPWDLTALRELLRDDRIWLEHGIVRARNRHDVLEHDDNSELEVSAPHYHIYRDGHILVDVDLSPTGTSVHCHLGGFAGSDGTGVWKIPEPGTDVIVALPGGSLRGQPTIVAIWSNGTKPVGLDGDVLLIRNAK